VPLPGGSELLDAGGELVWLGKLGAQSVFALDVSALPAPGQHPVLSRMEPKDLRFASATLPAEHATLAAYARAMLYWHGRQRHCGVCGGATAPRDGGHTRVCRAEACKTEFFPRTDPAVIMLVHDGERVLLGRQTRWPKGMFSTLAGFVEPGETIEEAVAREIKEESGVRVDDVRYFRSQPWPYPASLMIGFFARATSTEIDLGEQELEDARWFEREQLRDPKAHGFFVPGPFSIAGQLIAAWLAGEGPA
jgi:NAD+ diphosphatase